MEALKCRFYALDVGLGIATSSPKMAKLRRQVRGFYALDVGLGIATSVHVQGDADHARRFYALDVGLGIATDSALRSGLRAWHVRFLCPRRRAGYCDYSCTARSTLCFRFYALDVGLGIATRSTRSGGKRRERFYALDVGLGIATSHSPAHALRNAGFYALDVGLGIATRHFRGAFAATAVSMPSTSGWVLRLPTTRS